MGSVQNSIFCPQCGSEEAFYEYYYQSGEEYTFCPICGYRKEHSYQRDEKGAWIMQTDVYEIDGKTVGCSKLLESKGTPLLSDFAPFSPEHAAEELKHAEKESYVIKLDAREEYGFRYLSFWFAREVKYEGGKAFLHHTHPVIEDFEQAGEGICCVGADGYRYFYDIRDVDLNEMLHVIQQPEYRKESYMTRVKNGQVKVLAGTLPWSEQE